VHFITKCGCCTRSTTERSVSGSRQTPSESVAKLAIGGAISRNRVADSPLRRSTLAPAIGDRSAERTTRTRQRASAATGWRGSRSIATAAPGNGANATPPGAC
jgi:hypothetical protein